VDHPRLRFAGLAVAWRERIKPCAAQAGAKVGLHITKIYVILFCRRFVLGFFTLTSQSGPADGMSAANTGDNAGLIFMTFIELNP